MQPNILFALAAAALFGASTPLAKLLVGDVPPVLLAGLLYMGSGLGLSLYRVARDGHWKPSGLQRAEWPWLLGAILSGGVVAPVVLMVGLVSTSGATASLLLNLEAVLTALMAWLVFHENADRRIVGGMVAIVAGGVVLAWPQTGGAASHGLGPLWVALACLCWAIDNNLTRRVSASDAVFIAATKGLMAGVVNTLLGLGLGASLPPWNALAATLAVGLLGYGVSLVLFVLALRGLGTARTGAYFSTAPFIGAALALGVLGEGASLGFWLAAALMAVGVWLHLTEHHAHTHTHEPLVHSHAHTHDAHHQHAHEGEVVGEGPHEHLHTHAPLHHSHAHYPDIHHRHSH